MRSAKLVECAIKLLIHRVNKSKFISIGIPVIFTLNLASCAIDNGNILTGRIDQDELTSKVIQRFNMAKDDGVLRETVNGKYQLKLYDRNGVFDLPYEQNGYTVTNATVLSDDSLVLTLNAPRYNCNGHYYIFLIKQRSSDSFMTQTKNCESLVFEGDPLKNIWAARTLVPQKNGIMWIVQKGVLYSAQDPRWKTAEDASATHWRIESGSSNLPAKNNTSEMVLKSSQATNNNWNDTKINVPSIEKASFLLPDKVGTGSDPSSTPILINIK